MEILSMSVKECLVLICVSVIFMEVSTLENSTSIDTSITLEDDLDDVLSEPRLRWTCSGPLVKNSSECSELGSKGIGHGCYYLENFSQYKPCNEICNGTIPGSIEEERCNADCPEYLNKTCKKSGPPPPSSLPPPTSTQPPPPVDHSGRDIALGVVIPIVIISLLIFTLLTIRKCKRHCCRCGAQLDCRLCKLIDSCCFPCLRVDGAGRERVETEDHETVP